MRTLRLAASGVAVAMLVLAAAPARAANIPVSNMNDAGAGSLRAAIGIANGNGEGDSIILGPGTFNLSSGELAITEAGETLLIDGEPGATVIRQTGPFRVLRIGSASGNVDLIDLVITGGNVAGNGGGILSEAGTGQLNVENSVVEGNRSTTGGLASNAGGGGIYHAGSDLTLRRSTVRGNVATATGSGGGNGGGGIHDSSGAAPNIVQSTVSGNAATVSGSDSGGGGIWSDPFISLSDSTLSDNSLNVSGPAATNRGGGGMFALNAGSVQHVTVSGNSSSLPGGGLFNGDAVTPVDLINSILANNSASSEANCSGGDFDPGTTNNMETGPANSCGLPAGQFNIDPLLGPLTDNGGNTQTHALPPASPAIDAGDFGACTNDDQRDVVRPIGNGCDLGAYEFDGLSVAQVPDCSPTGRIPLGMTAPPGDGVVAFVYKIDNGADQSIPTPGGGDQASTVLDIPEGRRALEYWGVFGHGEEANHHTPQVLVDKTKPNVGIASEQRRSIYVITRRASVDVTAADALSGLVGDPSADGERIGTRTRGPRTVTKTATDLCGNLQSASLDYRVLGPGLGVRAVLERMRGRVRIRRPGSASAAQKGRPFVPLSQPREIPIRSLVDTRKGSIRLTSSRSRRATSIQDGVISAGLFQVLQSRRRASKGLTELRLKGSSFRRCRAGNRDKGAQGAISRRRIRRLRANVKGRFRTRGRFSAATVRGTDFTVVDRCDGTLTKVTRGRVAVRDFRRKKTVIVRAGNSYLAKAPARR